MIYVIHNIAHTSDDKHRRGHRVRELRKGRVQIGPRSIAEGRSASFSDAVYAQYKERIEHYVAIGMVRVQTLGAVAPSSAPPIVPEVLVVPVLPEVPVILEVPVVPSTTPEIVDDAPEPVSASAAPVDDDDDDDSLEDSDGTAHRRGDSQRPGRDSHPAEAPEGAKRRGKPPKEK